MIAFIDDHRDVFGVGPICRVLEIAPSTFYAFKAVERDPGLASDRIRQDRLDMAAIKDAFDGSRGRYGARKVWHQLRRSGHGIARCTVRAADEGHGVTRRCARHEGHHDQPRYGTTLPGRQGEPSLRGGHADPAVGQRLYLRLKLARDGLRGLHHRRLRPEDRWLACLDFDDHRLRPRCPEPGHLPEDAVRGRQADPSQRPRQPRRIQPVVATPR